MTLWIRGEQGRDEGLHVGKVDGAAVVEIGKVHLAEF